MNTLFIDTHSEKLIITIIKNEEIFTQNKISNRSHSEVAIPTLNLVLEMAKMKLTDIDQIIVVNGPGSFTGVRIGVTIAKTIAYSFNIPIKTITSLEMYGISDTKCKDIIAIHDPKGIYSAIVSGNEFSDFAYHKKSDFEVYAAQKNVSYNENICYPEIMKYVAKKPALNPHGVNPIYIKEIDALK